MKRNSVEKDLICLFFVFLDRSAAHSKSLPDSFIDEDTGFHRELEKKKKEQKKAALTDYYHPSSTFLTQQRNLKRK